MLPRLGIPFGEAPNGAREGACAPRKCRRLTAASPSRGGLEACAPSSIVAGQVQGSFAQFNLIIDILDL
jgi:hypothetical protein